MDNYNEGIAKAIKKVLDEKDYTYTFDEEEGTFIFSDDIGSQITKVDCFIDVHETRYTVKVMPAFKADETEKEKMLKLAEYLDRVNDLLDSGFLHLNFICGHIEYRLSIWCEDSLPSDETVKKSIFLPLIMLSDHMDGIISVWFTNISPEDALDQTMRNIFGDDIDDDECDCEFADDCDDDDLDDLFIADEDYDDDTDDTEE